MIRQSLSALVLLSSLSSVKGVAAPLLAPPPVDQRQGQALIGQGALCPALQSAVEAAVGEG